MSRTRTLVLATVAAIALVGGGAVLGASATSASGGGGSSASADTLDSLAYDAALTALGDDPAAGPGDTGGGNGLGGRVGQRHPFRNQGADRFLHGEVVLKDKDGKPVTVALQRGVVTAVDGSSVTVKSDDGYSRTWALTDDTAYRSLRDKASKSDVKVGATVRIAGAVTDGNATARIVGIPPVGGKPGQGTSPAPHPSASAETSSTA
jgi:Domain of unknown function (DUF5666)